MSTEDTPTRDSAPAAFVRPDWEETHVPRPRSRRVSRGRVVPSGLIEMPIVEGRSWSRLAGRPSPRLATRTRSSSPVRSAAG